MRGRGVDRSAVRAYARDISHLGQRVEVKDADVPGRARPSNIQVAAVRVGSHIIESAIASNQLNLEDLVGATRLSVGQARKRKQNGDGCNDKRLAGHGGISSGGISGPCSGPDCLSRGWDSASSRNRAYTCNLKVG